MYEATGYVKINGIGIERQVNLYNRDDGELINSGFSDRFTGLYTITTETNDMCYVVILEDELTQKYRSEVRDFIIPTLQV